MSPLAYREEDAEGFCALWVPPGAKLSGVDAGGVVTLSGRGVALFTLEQLRFD